MLTLREMQGDGENEHMGMYKLLVMLWFGVYRYSFYCLRIKLNTI